MSTKKKQPTSPQRYGQQHEFQGKLYYLRNFSETFKIPLGVIYFRIKRGHTLEDIYQHYSPECPEEKRNKLKDKPMFEKTYRYKGKEYEAKELIRTFKIPKSCFYEQININGKSVEEVIENYSRLEDVEARAMGFRRVGRQLKIRTTLENGIVILTSPAPLGEAD